MFLDYVFERVRNSSGHTSSEKNCRSALAEQPTDLVALEQTSLGADGGAVG